MRRAKAEQLTTCCHKASMFFHEEASARMSPYMSHMVPYGIATQGMHTHTHTHTAHHYGIVIMTLSPRYQHTFHFGIVTKAEYQTKQESCNTAQLTLNGLSTVRLLRAAHPQVNLLRHQVAKQTLVPLKGTEKAAYARHVPSLEAAHQ
eukprot:148124-Pelagomonas_calceolata.AAC.12